MNTTFLHHVLQAAEQMAAKERLGSLSDAELWQRFASDHDNAAFAQIVRRHGALVWGVCRQLLTREADAEDAFQATFLAFVHAANKVRKPQALASWLHGVAYRVAMKARRTMARRLKREGIAAQTEATHPISDDAWERLQIAVHEEVSRLPDTLRTPFVLCCLQGTPQPEAAEQLGWKLGTLSGRLTKARQTLFDRLVRRGVALGTASVATALASFSTAAPPALVEQTTILTNPTTVPSSIHYLAQGATTVYFTRFKFTIAAMLMLGLLTCSVRYGLFSTADAQDRITPVAVKNQPPKTFWEYKLVPLTKTYTSKEFLALLSEMETQGAWEYCGTQALNESVIATATEIKGNAGLNGLARVEHMVFKRRVSIVQNDVTHDDAAKLAQAEKEYLNRLSFLQKARDAERLADLNARQDAERQREAARVREQAALALKKGEADIVALETETATAQVRLKSVAAKLKVFQDTGDVKTTELLRNELLEAESQVRQCHARLEQAKVTLERLRKDVEAASTPKSVISKISDVYNAAGVKPVDDIQIVRLQHAKATALGGILQELIIDLPALQVRIVADERTNTLILSGPTKDIDKVKGLIKQLDNAQ